MDGIMWTLSLEHRIGWKIQKLLDEMKILNEGWMGNGWWMKSLDKVMDSIFVGIMDETFVWIFLIDLFYGIHGWKHSMKWLDEFSRLFVWMNFHIITWNQKRYLNMFGVMNVATQIQ
jgi:hypothetical protein